MILKRFGTQVVIVVYLESYTDGSKEYVPSETETIELSVFRSGESFLAGNECWPGVERQMIDYTYIDNDSNK